MSKLSLYRQSTECLLRPRSFLLNFNALLMRSTFQLNRPESIPKRGLNLFEFQIGFGMDKHRLLNITRNVLGLRISSKNFAIGLSLKLMKFKGRINLPLGKTQKRRRIDNLFSKLCLFFEMK